MSSLKPHFKNCKLTQPTRSISNLKNMANLKLKKMREFCEDSIERGKKESDEEAEFRKD